MKFPFRTCPDWFINFLCDKHLDSFHEFVADEKINLNTDKELLMHKAQEYFGKQGFICWVQDYQLWFEIDENSNETFFNILKWS
jgi:hypothetical protein